MHECNGCDSCERAEKEGVKKTRLEKVALIGGEPTYEIVYEKVIVRRGLFSKTYSFMWILKECRVVDASRAEDFYPEPIEVKKEIARSDDPKELKEIKDKLENPEKYY